MYVQAQAEGGLAIRWAGKTSALWGTTASAEMKNETGKKATLLPASTYNLEDWTYAKASAPYVKTANPDTWDDITEDVMGTDKTYQKDNGYVLMQEFEIRSTSTQKPAKGLFVSNVTVTGDNTIDMNKSIRVGVRYVPDGDNPVPVCLIYKPVGTPDKDGYTFTSGKEGHATHAIPTLTSYGTKGDTNSQILADSSSIPDKDHDPVKVQIFIWYEGEDGALYSDNYANNVLNVSVDFSSYE